MFWELYVQLCNQKNESPNAVAQKLGFSTGTVTWWKKGRHPRSTALQKIADYFDVTVGYLLGKEEKPLPLGRIIEREEDELWAKIIRLDETDRIKIEAYADGLLAAEKYQASAKIKKA